MKFLYTFWALFVTVITFTNIVSAQQYTYTVSVDSQSMEAVLEHYCETINSVSRCGVYQYEIDQAQLRAVQLTNILRTYPIQERKTIIEWLLEKISRAFYNAHDTNTKVVAAWYYVYFSQQISWDITASSWLFDYLFENGNTPREYSYLTPTPTNTYRNTYSNTYTNNPYKTSPYTTSSSYTQTSWSIVNIWSLNKYTRVDNSRKDIEVSYNRNLSVWVRAQIGTSFAGTNGYRVVASLPWKQTAYVWNYKRDWTWDFTFGKWFSNERSVTFSLLCQRCSEWTKYNKSPFRGWTVLDTITYSLDIENNRYSNNNYNNRYYNDCYDSRWRYNSRYCDNNDRYYNNNYYNNHHYNDGDLWLTRLEYEYDERSNDSVIELVTTVKNYSRYELTLDELQYDVEINGRRARETSDYRVYHKRTQCDDSSVRSSASEDIDIEGHDECEITVELRFDNDLYNDRVEIEVELDSRDDDTNSNNTRRVEFSVR